MRIGSDYPKVEFELFGLDLVEPNAMIGDGILFVTAILFAFKIRSFGRQNDAFFRNWSYFFFVFGFSFLWGGIGHSFFNYLDIPGKYPGWYLGIFASYFIELAMISISFNELWKKRLVWISRLKLLLAFVGASLVFLYADLEADSSIGLRIPSLNTTIGIVFSMGVLGWRAMKNVSPAFRYHFISVFVLLPTAIFQTFKISFAPLFDRNDASHIFLWLSLVLYYWGVRGYEKSLANNPQSI